MENAANNIFDVKNYFTLNYGLGSKPIVPPLNKKNIMIGVLLCLTLIGAIIGIPMLIFTFVKHAKAKSKLTEWQNNYDIRFRTWDVELRNFYKKTVDAMNLKEVAMEKIGIVDDDVKEITPFSIHGQTYNGWYRFGADGNIRTDDREITWLFFGKDQIYIYTVSFSLTGRKSKVENTQEFFYTDIVSVSTGSVSKKLNTQNSTNSDDGGRDSVESEEFKLIVPGDKISFAFTSNDTISRSIQAMKNKIREKKNS